MALAFLPTVHSEPTLTDRLVSFEYGMTLASLAADKGEYFDLDFWLDVCQDFAADYELSAVREGIAHYEMTQGVKL